MAIKFTVHAQIISFAWEKVKNTTYSSRFWMYNILSCTKHFPKFVKVSFFHKVELNLKMKSIFKMPIDIKFWRKSLKFQVKVIILSKEKRLSSSKISKIFLLWNFNKRFLIYRLIWKILTLNNYLVKLLKNQKTKVFFKW